jgi:hypothetical protein
MDDRIYIYVDFVQIVSTTSPDDALALLIAMYTIFELSFNKNSRTIRLLYSICHSEKRFLSNSIRIFIKDKNIDIFAEETQKESAPFNSISNNSAAVTLKGQSQSQPDVISQSSLSKQGELNMNEVTDECSSDNTFDSNSNISITKKQ